MQLDSDQTTMSQAELLNLLNIQQQYADQTISSLQHTTSTLKQEMLSDNNFTTSTNSPNSIYKIPRLPSQSQKSIPKLKPSAANYSSYSSYTTTTAADSSISNSTTVTPDGITGLGNITYNSVSTTPEPYPNQIQQIPTPTTPFYQSSNAVSNAFSSPVRFTLARSDGISVFLQCPVCQHTQFPNVDAFIDHLIGTEQLPLFQSKDEEVTIRSNPDVIMLEFGVLLPFDQQSHESQLLINWMQDNGHDIEHEIGDSTWSIQKYPVLDNETEEEDEIDDDTEDEDTIDNDRFKHLRSKLKGRDKELTNLLNEFSVDHNQQQFQNQSSYNQRYNDQIRTPYTDSPYEQQIQSPFAQPQHQQLQQQQQEQQQQFMGMNHPLEIGEDEMLYYPNDDDVVGRYNGY